jgi:hypothetical protein
MARFCKYIILFTSYIFLLSSCQEGGEAGDLFGMWRLKHSDTKSISFAGSIVLFRDTNGTQIYGHFSHVSDSLYIECISTQGTHTKEEVDFIETGFGFKPFNDIRLRINTLDDDNLVLSKDGSTWSFYKY